nr:rep protein [Cressdnaviricota sp.]
MDTQDLPPGRHRHWCITINNWSQEEYSQSLLAPYRYIIIGRERSENNTPHLQIYLELKSPMSFSSLKKKYFPRGHLELRRGSREQARDYCKKEHFFEYGEFTTNQGKRNDFKIALELLEQGISIRKGIESEMITTLGTLTSYERLQKYYSVHRTRPRVLWFYGPGGSGKTSTALSLTGDDVYIASLLTKGWMDGYDRHRAIIVDDLDTNSDDSELFNSLLSLLDRNPLRMNAKNTSVSITAELIIITSQKAPWHIWFSSEDMSLVHSSQPTREQIERDVQLQQIMRRIEEVRYFKRNEELQYPKITEQS